MNHASVGDLGFAQAQPLQQLDLLDVGQAGIGHCCALEVQNLEFGQSFQVNQAGIAYFGATVQVKFFDVQAFEMFKPNIRETSAGKGQKGQLRQRTQMSQSSICQA